MKILITVILVTFQIGTILTSGLGKCPIHLLMDNFNITGIYGKWYEIQHSFFLVDLTFGCTTITLDELKPQQIQIKLKTINQWTGNGVEVNGIAKLEHPNIPKLDFIFQTHMPSAVARFLPGSGLYQILESDYKTFTILYSCTSYNFAYTDQIWVLAREPELTADVLGQVERILVSWGLDESRMIKPKYKFCDQNM